MISNSVSLMNTPVYCQMEVFQLVAPFLLIHLLQHSYSLLVILGNDGQSEMRNRNRSVFKHLQFLLVTSRVQCSKQDHNVPLLIFTLTVSVLDVYKWKSYVGLSLDWMACIWIDRLLVWFLWIFFFISLHRLLF